MAFKKKFSKNVVFWTCIVLCGCTKQTNVQEQPQLSSKTLSTFQPESNVIIQRQGYKLAYDGKIRSASWVYEKLTASSVAGHIDRSHFDFMEDPEIPALLRSTKKDFKGSGFDKGHLCPAADTKSSAEAMKETFYLSNISPQDPQLNRKYWRKLEKYIRDLTKSYDVIYVITGPLFLPKKMKNGKRYVQYEVIGPNDVAVPTHYFKVFQAEKGKKVNTEAYIIPNEPVQEDYPLKNFMVTLEKVEKAAGIIFKKR